MNNTKNMYNNNKNNIIFYHISFHSILHLCHFFFTVLMPFVISSEIYLHYVKYCKCVCVIYFEFSSSFRLLFLFVRYQLTTFIFFLNNNFPLKQWLLLLLFFVFISLSRETRKNSERFYVFVCGNMQ